MPSRCRAARPGSSELPAEAGVGLRAALIVIPSKTGRDESKNEPVEKAPAEQSSSPIKKCSKDQRLVVRFRPGTSKSDMGDGEKWPVSLRERNAPVSTVVQEIWTS